jgi:hypothetical protein
MWDLEQALRVVRALQPVTREYNYHLAIGGGVVNNGESKKDLDLYFLPMGGFPGNEKPTNPDGLLKRLEKLWGASIPLQASLDTAKYGPSCYKHAVKFNRRWWNPSGATNQRIDCFIF